MSGNTILAMRLTHLDQEVFKGGLCKPDQLDIDKCPHYWVQRKPFAEDPKCGYVHFIPYILVKVGDKVLKYERSNKGGEARLHNAISIGIGGHVDLDADIAKKENGGASITDMVRHTASKELREEIGVVFSESSFEIVGYIYDRTTEVNKVHLGVMMVVKCTDEAVGDLLTGGEIDQLVNREILSTSELRAMYEDRLESWSRIAVENVLF